MTSDITVRPVTLEDTMELNNSINQVCQERKWLALVDGFDVEQTRQFLSNSVDNGFPHRVACIDDRLVGWCDIIPDNRNGYTHVGYLGMGVLADFRDRGIGRVMLDDCLSAARAFGLERVELEVYTDNSAAISLYERFGFQVEGIKRKARKLDGRYQDIQLMALMWN